MTSQPRLGALRAATIVCSSLEQAIAAYEAGLGYQLLETGEISAERAASWGTPGHAGDRYAVLGPVSGGKTYIRFVENKTIPAHKPYSTLGWNSIEISVQSSDETIDRLAKVPFEIVGPAQDLDFSKGALRAGQVIGSFGETMYLTQINHQIDDYVLPQASVPQDKLFIVILGVTTVEAAYEAYGAMGGVCKPTFEAAVDFVNRYQGMPLDHEMLVGCVETTDESYIEVDESPEYIAPREALPGLLPAGIAMVSFGCADISDGGESMLGASWADEGPINIGQPSLVIKGRFGELIELVQTSE